jgi:hypothetical protein
MSPPVGLPQDGLGREMLPGVSEAATIAKVSGSVVEGLQRANQPVSWPNVREALLELHAILAEWCTRAQETTDYVQDCLDDRRMQRQYEEDPSTIPPDSNLIWGLRIALPDINKTLEAKAPLLKRWRASRRREAARRSLRTILSVYSPELIQQFEQAVRTRVDWLLEYQNSFDRWFDSHTEEDAAQLMCEMEATRRGLVEAESKLRELITTNFPLSHI